MTNPTTISALLCGQFGKTGLTLRDGLAFFKHDHWNNDVAPKHQRNNVGAPDYQDVDSPRDYAYFKGTHFMVGANFSLPDPVGGGSRGYGLARFDPDTQKWVGLLFGSETSSGPGWSMFVWDDGGGERLYIEMQTTDAPIGPKLKKCDYDPTTKVFTVSASPLADRADPVVDSIVYDDGNGSEVYLLGTSDGLFPMGGTGPSIGTRVTDACIHDFGDGLGQRLVAVGNNGVEAWNTSTSVWDSVGIGTPTITSFDIGRIESHNGILWLATGTLFLALPHGTGQAGKRWVNAGSVVEGLDGDSPLWKFVFTTSNQRKNTNINRLRKYGDRLAVAGDFDFRETNRNRLKSGPLAYYSSSDDSWHRALPILSGNVNAILSYLGGVLACGTIHGSLPDGTVIKGAGVWHDPGGIDNEGTWESIGEIEGEVLDAIVFQNDLYIVGDISSAGGVAVDGIARRDINGVWHRVVNISDYGTARSLLVANGKLVIAGDFFKVDGQAKFKIICTWDGSSLGTLLDDINALDGLPFINDMELANGVVYVVGWFDTLDPPFASPLTARCVAQMNETTEVWSAMFDSDSPPEEGINNGRVAYAVGVAGGDVYVGADPDASFGDSAFPSQAAVWRWNIATPSWFTVPVDSFADPGRTLAIFSDTTNDKVMIHVHGVSELGFSATATDRVEEHAPINYLGGQGGVSFSSEITAMWRGSGGATDRRWAGGSFDKIGTPLDSPASKLAGHIFFIDGNNKVVEAAGGLGVTAYLDQFTSDENVLQMRLFDYTDTSKPSTTTTLKATAHGWLDESAPSVPRHDDALLRLGRPTASKSGRVVLLFGLDGITGDIESAKLKLKGATPAVVADTAKAFRLLVGFDEDFVSWLNRDAGSTWTVAGASLSGADRSSDNPATFVLPVIQDSDIEIDVTAMVKDHVSDRPSGRSPVFGVILQDDDETAATINVWSIRKTAEIEIKHKSNQCGPTLVICGFFPWTADTYSEYLIPLDIHGRTMSMHGGLSGSQTLDQPGAFDGVNGAAAIPRDRWPTEWHDVITPCQPNSRFAWLVGGSFNHGVNDRIEDENIGKVIEDNILDSIAVLNGGHIFKVTKRPPRSYCQQVEVFGGKIISAGGLQAPCAYDDTVQPIGQWDFLMEQNVAGAIVGSASSIHRLMYFEGLLWLAGDIGVFPSTATKYALATWNGTAPYALIEPVGFLKNTFSPDIGTPVGRCLVISDISGAEQIYMGGTANTNQCPVVTRSPAGVWSAVGGASQLRGTCNNMAIVDRGIGKGYIIASGNFSVDEGGGFFTTKLVVFDGTSWSRAGFNDANFGPEDGAAMTNNLRHAWCEDQGAFGIRAWIGGQLSEIALNSSDIGTPSSIPVHGVAQWQRSLAGRWSRIPGGGVDGTLKFMASADRLLYPKDGQG